MAEQSGKTQVELARHLGLFEATMIGVGAMIGAGIFVLTGIATGNAGPAALLAFGLNGVVTLLTALSYAELSSAIPEAGGGYSFVKKVMPNPVAFASGWMLWFAYVVACSLYSKGFGSYFFELSEREFPSVGDWLVDTFGRGVSIALLTILVGLLFLAINVIGAHASGQTENVITLAKIAILAVFISYGVRQVVSDPEMARANMTPLLPNGFGGVLSAMGLTFIAFEGYDLIATISEEVKDPRRNIPKAILYSLGITVVIYLLVVFVCLGAVAPDEGLPTWQLLGEYGEIGVVRAAQSFMPAFGVMLVLFGGLFATLSALNATVLASSRVAFSMGRDWMLPNRLSRLHAARKTPVMAIVVSGVLFLAVAVFLPLETIGTASSLLFLLTFALVNASLMVYRRRSRELPPFKVPLYPLTPVLGIATCLGLAIFQLFHEWLAWGLAAGWVAVGMGIYALSFARRARVADVSRVIETPELLRLKTTRRYRVLVPIANPERVEALMQTARAIAGASQGEILALKVVQLPSVTAYSQAKPFVEEAQLVLNEAERQALSRGTDVPFSALLKVGRDAADEIVRVAHDHRADLILMGYKKEEDPLENSIIHQVISEQPCDIAILKSSARHLGDFERVLVPMEGRAPHAQLKVRLVHSLHRESGCKVTLMTVIEPGIDEASRHRAAATLREQAQIYQIPGAQLLVDERDDPARAIIDRAGDHDLVVLGMREEPWLSSFLFGDVAQAVAARVRCPVLLTKTRSRGARGLRQILRRLGGGRTAF